MSDPSDAQHPPRHPAHPAHPADPAGTGQGNGGPSSASSLSAVPLFPLPNVVLLPRAVLPLHIFEERYKLMTAHAITGGRQIAMALLRPGWERDYYCKPAIEPVVCVGDIISHEKLPDGKYNFLLRGRTRARVVRELPVPGLPYRVAELRPLEDIPATDSDLEAERRRLAEVFEHDLLGHTPLGKQFRRMLTGPAAVPTADAADLIAFTLLDDVALKQELLAEPDVRRRVARTADALQALRPPAHFAAYYRGPNDPSVN